MRNVSIRITFCSPSVIQICGAPRKDSCSGGDLMMVGRPRRAFIRFTVGGRCVHLGSSMLRMRMGSSANKVGFCSTAKEILLGSGSCKARFAPFSSTNAFSCGIQRTFLLSGSRIVCKLKRRRAKGIGRHGRGLFLHGGGVDVYVPFVRSIGNCKLC